MILSVSYFVRLTAFAPVTFSPFNRFLTHPVKGEMHLSLRASHGVREHVPNLKEYLESKDVDMELSTVISATARACLNISNELSILPIRLSEETHFPNQGTNVQGELQTPMDVIANEICIDSIKGTVPMMASEEVEDVIPGELLNGKYQIAFDPLDGSSNLDVSIPTG